jgi:hypothetical protein
LSENLQRFQQLLEKRIELMQSLASSLAIANSSLLNFDLANLESAINRQEQLSVAIRSLDSEVSQVQKQYNDVFLLSTRAPVFSARLGAENGIRSAMERLAQIQSTVRKLNDTHFALLQKSRRTVHALLNAYHSFASLYSNPHSKLPADRALAAERV